MRMLTLMLLALVVALTCSGPQDQGPREPSASSAGLRASVIRVVAGDSLDARVNGVRMAIGLLGVRTPAPGEPCGAEALARTRELSGEQVLLESDASQDLDERGRRLYYAYSLDGTSIDATLVSEGLGTAQYPDAMYGTHLAELQAQAEATRLGCLWTDPT
jgi:endonuclease YncB( thermonuclease family)